jgi:hypothetical protein
MSERPVTVKTLPEEGPITCPRRLVGGRCGGIVVNVDRAIRWNAITFADGKPWVSTAATYEFEADPDTPFICTNCYLPVQLPDGALEEASYS